MTSISGCGLERTEIYCQRNEDHGNDHCDGRCICRVVWRRLVTQVNKRIRFGSLLRVAAREALRSPASGVTLCGQWGQTSTVRRRLVRIASHNWY
jgi:hypothetical protein